MPTNLFNRDLPTDTNDDPEYVRLVSQIVVGVIRVHSPSATSIFKIDNWFSHKWLAFSGKVVGAVGSWRQELTVPPFVTNRILAEVHYCRDVGGEYQPHDFNSRIHHCGASADNLRRYVSKLAPNSALFWYSANTGINGRGSLMAHVPTEDDHWAWYLSLERQQDWQAVRRKRIHDYELRMFYEAGKQASEASIQL
jgi:hypothetical protein